MKWIERGLKDKEMGRGHLFWTKKISVNEWCLVSSVGVLGGGQKQLGRERQTSHGGDAGVYV